MKPWLEPVFDDLLRIGSRIQSVDPYLTLMLNRKTKFYEVHDRHPKVHPNHTMVMRIQTEDGKFRHPSIQDLVELNRLRQLAPEKVYAELGQIEEAREREWHRKDNNLMIAMAEDLKWAGKAVARSLSWKARSTRPDRVS